MAGNSNESTLAERRGKEAALTNPKKNTGNPNESNVTKESGREAAPTNPKKKRDQSKAREGASLEPVVAEFGEKLEKPQGFNGARDAKEVKNYLWWIEQYFEGIGLNDEAAKLDTWDEFKKELKKLFYPENVVYEARKKLRELKQQGIMWDYDGPSKEIHLRDVRTVDEAIAIAKSIVDFQPYSHTNAANNKDKYLAEGPHPMSSCPKLGLLLTIVVRQDTKSQAEMGSLQVINALKAKSLTPSSSNGLMYVEASVSKGWLKTVNTQAVALYGMARGVELRLGSWKGQVNFSVIPIDDFKVILGLDFLRQVITIPMPSFSLVCILEKGSPCMIPMVEALKVQGRDTKQLSAIKLGRGIKKGAMTYLAMLKKDDEIEKMDDLPPIIREVLEEKNVVRPLEDYVQDTSRERDVRQEGKVHVCHRGSTLPWTCNRPREAINGLEQNQGHNRVGAVDQDLLKKRKTWEWSEQCQKAFEDLKAVVSQEPVLVLPYFTKPFEETVYGAREGDEDHYPLLVGVETLITWCTLHHQDRQCGDELFSNSKEAVTKTSHVAGLSSRVRLYVGIQTGKANVVADTLSRKAELIAISLAKGTMLERIKEGLEQDPVTRELVKLSSDGKTQRLWVEDGLLYTKGRVEFYVKTCPVCQQDKVENRQLAGLLEPLPVPQRLWDSITLDFISAFPKITKEHHQRSRPSIHRTPMDELFKLLGTELNFSTSFHPQTNGQAKRVNALLECYLRHFVSANQRDWAKFLAVAQFSYNLQRSEATGQSLFELTTGQQPLTPHTLTMSLDEGKSPGAAKMAKSWEENADIARASFATIIQNSLKRSQRTNTEIRGTVPGTCQGGELAEDLWQFEHRAPPVVTKSYDKEVEIVLTSRTVRKRGVLPRTVYLIKWKGLPESEATWELAEDLWQFKEHLKVYEATGTTLK
ncbi:hypothetical protein F3Y22_tig00110831pilonHSYRG00013 [Hibiscus syriacus]|uniref:Chromo domain-containing protein n=1 Tax=Hibiscus syriacus TaxID=106335 RepID=A0A6A2ZKZ4_HIBSY|nr:hypothetical protein F3Y22_tig00110831pilonHSYRG00013 [Hibiscus syriacus]